MSFEKGDGVVELFGLAEVEKWARESFKYTWG